MAVHFATQTDRIDRNAAVESLSFPLHAVSIYLLWYQWNILHEIVRVCGCALIMKNEKFCHSGALCVIFLPKRHTVELRSWSELFFGMLLEANRKYARIYPEAGKPQVFEIFISRDAFAWLIRMKRIREGSIVLTREKYRAWATAYEKNAMREM